MIGVGEYSQLEENLLIPVLIKSEELLEIVITSKEFITSYLGYEGLKTLSIPALKANSIIDWVEVTN